MRDRKYLTSVCCSLGDILNFSSKLTSEVVPILQMGPVRLTEGVLHLQLITILIVFEICLPFLAVKNGSEIAGGMYSKSHDRSNMITP